MENLQLVLNLSVGTEYDSKQSCTAVRENARGRNGRPDEPPQSLAGLLSCQLRRMFDCEQRMRYSPRVGHWGQKKCPVHDEGTTPVTRIDPLQCGGRCLHRFSSAPRSIPSCRIATRAKSRGFQPSAHEKRGDPGWIEQTISLVAILATMSCDT